MNPIRRIRRIAGVLAGLACAWLGIAIAAPAAFAAMSVPPPSGRSAAITLPSQPPEWYKHLPPNRRPATWHEPRPCGRARRTATLFRTGTTGRATGLSHIPRRAQDRVPRPRCRPNHQAHRSRGEGHT